MQRIVLTFGLIAGAILSVMMLLAIPFHDQIGFDKGYIIGYTTMVLAFLMIFVGAYFGLLVYLTGSLWAGILAHAVNNLAVIVLMWIYKGKLPDFVAPWWMYVLSAVVFGLAIGKPLGIATAAWIAIRMRVASAPDDISPRKCMSRPGNSTARLSISLPSSRCRSTGRRGSATRSAVASASRRAEATSPSSRSSE